MHHLIGAVVVAFLALFPVSVEDGGLNLKAWMAAYEKYLYQQMYDNIENARRNEEICQNSAKNEVLHEQTASEKVAKEPSDAGAGGDLVQHTAEETFEDVEVVEVPVQDGEETTMAAEVESHERNGQTPLFSVNGAVLDIGVQEYLYQRLCEANIGWFYQYAILIAYQESRFDFYAVNQKNHLDMGLFQYRSTFWNYGDIFNPYDQINVFTVQMMQRANVGCSVAEMISRHKTSDWGGYDQEYVNQVMQWESTLVRIR